MSGTVLVTGGTGNLGRQVVRRLVVAGFQVRVASRGPQPDDELNHQWATVDYRTRAGLDAALDGIDVVIHCASGSTKGEGESMAALLSSGRRAGLRHLIYISIVGVDALPMGYYRAKLSSEKALIASGLGWTILRATQFHDLALRLVTAMCKPPIGVVPRRVSCQPVAVDEVAARLVALAGGPPAGRSEIGGPQILTCAELAGLYLDSIDSRKRVVSVPLPGKLAGRLRAGHQLTPDHAAGSQTFGDFLLS